LNIAKEPSAVWHYQYSRGFERDEEDPPEVERQQKLAKNAVFRADAAFAKPGIYEALEEQGVKFAIVALPLPDG
jgi:hypothetical protein